MNSRVKIEEKRNKSLENADRIVSSMNKSELRPIMSKNQTMERDDHYAMKLSESMSEKKDKKKIFSTPESPWNYPCLDLSFKEIPKQPPFKHKLGKLSPKSSELPLNKIKERIRRVPPPNFMIGMRDLHKVYESDPRIDFIPKHSRNLSSIC